MVLLAISSFCVQEQVEETYIMVKPDGVQRGLVSLCLILFCVICKTCVVLGFSEGSLIYQKFQI